jgi:hypothetical protein
VSFVISFSVSGMGLTEIELGDHLQTVITVMGRACISYGALDVLAIDMLVQCDWNYRFHS